MCFNTRRARTRDYTVVKFGHFFYQCAAGGGSAGLVGKETAQWTIKKLSGFKYFYYTYGMKKSCCDIQFLFNWKDSPQFSGTYLELFDWSTWLSCLRSKQRVEYKSDNIQYNTLSCWVAGTNDSWTKYLMFKVLYFFIISYRHRALKILISFL